MVDGFTTLLQERYRNADTFITVANGASRLGQPLIKELGIRHVDTRKDDNKNFSLRDELNSGEKVVLIDDVYTRGTNLGKVANLCVVAGAKIEGAAVICDRSGKIRPKLDIQKPKVVRSLIQYYIPTST